MFMAGLLRMGFAAIVTVARFYAVVLREMQAALMALHHFLGLALEVRRIFLYIVHIFFDDGINKPCDDGQ